MNTETITKLRVQSRNNYTLSTEQDITAWCWHGVITRVAVAIGLDTARREAIEREGYSGTGAGARLLAMLSDETEEEVEDMTNSLVAALPLIAGNCQMRDLRETIKRGRRADVWNGNNFVAVPAENCSAILHEIRHPAGT